MSSLIQFNAVMSSVRHSWSVETCYQQDVRKLNEEGLPSNVERFLTCTVVRFFHLPLLKWHGSFFKGYVMEERWTRKNEKRIEDYRTYVAAKEFPCVAAKAAVAKKQVQCMVATHMACRKDDRDILQFLYAFVDYHRSSDEMYHSAAVIFQQPTALTEEAFDEFLWQRLPSLSCMDAANFGYGCVLP